MEILTSAQMKRVDEETINRFCPGLELMERAGRKVAEFILETFDNGDVKVVIFAGAGNNGGDALVAARYLAEEGFECSVHMLKPLKNHSMDALKNLQRLEKLSKRIRNLREVGTERSDWPDIAAKDLADSTLIVDGLFGTGVRGPLRGRAKEAVEMMNSAWAPVISIDVPSGVDGDNGTIPGTAVKADYTVTVGRPKLGLLFHPGRAHTGEMVVADIGFPQEVVDANSAGIFMLDGGEAALRLPARPGDAHKYQCGSLLLLAGSRQYTGAAMLAAEAALRGGCGMVFAAVPESIKPIVQGEVKEAVVIALPETSEGSISTAAGKAIENALEKADAVAIGPGLGANPETGAVIRDLLARIEKPAVLDADGINACAGKGDLLRNIKAPTVITPHSGELKRLLDEEIPSNPLDRIEAARRTASKLDLVLLYKGAPTILASPQGEVLVSLHGNSALATGGTGDVLAGLTGSILAQGAACLDAACCACFLLGRSGEIAAMDMGLRGVVAGDLLLYMGSAMSELEDRVP